MYRNSEYYADPTAGRALAHISYEKREAKRCKRAYQKNSVKAHTESERQRKREARKARRRAIEDRWHYVLVWDASKGTVVNK